MPFYVDIYNREKKKKKNCRCCQSLFKRQNYPWQNLFIPGNLRVQCPASTFWTTPVSLYPSQIFYTPAPTPPAWRWIVIVVKSSLSSRITGLEFFGKKYRKMCGIFVVDFLYDAWSRGHEKCIHYGRT